jgi:acyl carrier protein
LNRAAAAALPTPDVKTARSGRGCGRRRGCVYGASQSSLERSGSGFGLSREPNVIKSTRHKHMAQDIASEVRRIIKEQLDVEEKDIKPESTFIEDLGADSLGLVELVLAFEEAFEIDIPDEDTQKIVTVQDAVDYIEKNARK